MHAQFGSVGGKVCQVLTLPDCITSLSQAGEFLDTNPLLTWTGRITVAGNREIRRYVIGQLGFRGRFSEILERVSHAYDIVHCSHERPVGSRIRNLQR